MSEFPIDSAIIATVISVGVTSLIVFIREKKLSQHDGKKKYRDTTKLRKNYNRMENYLVFYILQDNEQKIGMIQKVLILLKHLTAPKNSNQYFKKNYHLYSSKIKNQHYLDFNRKKIQKFSSYSEER